MVRTKKKDQLSLGAHLGHFKVWAPVQEKISIELLGKGTFPMESDQKGYFHATLKEAQAGDRYFYLLSNGERRPDPVSRFLPDGIFGPTEIIDPESYQWQDHRWKGLSFEEYIIYELHVGTFSSQGTYKGVIEKIPYLKALGINCIDLMPLAQFSGRCNWGYDGVSWYAPHNEYGRPEELKELVDQCHLAGIAVSLDLVYSHLGPEGNFLGDFAPYFSTHYQSEWGDTLNYDGKLSAGVREMVRSNALYWITEYHIDCLRLDAIQAIYDGGESHFLQELVEEVKEVSQHEGRIAHIMAESDRNDSRILRPKEEHGYGITGLWNDEFHHGLHILLTGERGGYYRYFSGDVKSLASTIGRGTVRESLFDGIALNQFVVFAQNHDQIGNHPLSARLISLISPELARIIPFFVLLTPGVPLLFMGEEYGERNRFSYFVDFEDQGLMEAVYKGRTRAGFGSAEFPPTYEAFLHSKLSWKEDLQISPIYKKLIEIRKSYLPKRVVISQEKGIEVYINEELSTMGWSYESVEGKKIYIICHWGEDAYARELLPTPYNEGEILFATEAISSTVPAYSAFVTRADTV